MVTRTVTPPSNDQKKAYQFDLTNFLIDSAQRRGDANSYTDQNGNDVLRPTPPASTFVIADAGNLLRNWHTMTLEQVLDSVRLFISFVDNAVDRQNLAWTFQYLMNSIDADLRAFVLSKISHLPTDLGRSGPVAFMIIAQRMLQTTENLAQKVINGFIALRLTHFDGESVVEAIFTVRNVLKFLRYGEANSFAPRTSIVLLFDVFRGSTVSVFCNYVQQAQDIVLKDVTNVETIFDHLQSKYEELLLADRWVPTKKKSSAFVLGEPHTRTFKEAEEDKKSPPASPDKKDCPTHDKSGKKIDYTPPKPGEPHERTVNGVTEYWCGKCGRWGNHKTADHDEWRKNYRNRRNNRNRNNGNNNNASNNNNDSANRASTPGNRTRGSVTFISALTGNNQSFAVDAELANGIDL